ncbi:DUF551 domain-containing protein [Microvirga sp. P5_D2]
MTNPIVSDEKNLGVTSALRARSARTDSTQSQSCWQPIETAPKGKDTVLGWGTYRDSKRCVIAFMNYSDWLDDWFSHCLPFEPTHWMPLPPAPSVSDEQREYYDAWAKAWLEKHIDTLTKGRVSDEHSQSENPQGSSAQHASAVDCEAVETPSLPSPSGDIGELIERLKSEARTLRIHNAQLRDEMFNERSENTRLKQERDEARARLIVEHNTNRERIEAAESLLDSMKKALEEQDEHRKLKEDVDALIEEAREEERFEAATLWPEWADKLLKILRAYGVPCDDEEGVDLPEELREWLSDYKDELSRSALSQVKGGSASPRSLDLTEINNG